MDDIRFGAVVRSVRLRRGIRQVDVAARAGVSGQTVSRVERGHLETFSVRTLRAIGGVLEIRLQLAPWSRHGDLSRFATADHAALVEAVVRTLDALDWEARAELSFSEYGERGFIDILAWHASTRTLLVIEVKTRIVDIGETVGILDRKVRLAAGIAARFGWVPSHVACVLIVREDRTNRRRIDEHRATFASLLPAGTRRFWAWLRQPEGPLGAVAFWSASRSNSSDSHRGATRQRRGAPRAANARRTRSQAAD